MILGDRCLSELSGEDHKRVPSALASFLKPECFKLYIGEMEEEVRRHLEMHWNGKKNISLTFNIICTLLLVLNEERGELNWSSIFKRYLKECGQSQLIFLSHASTVASRPVQGHDTSAVLISFIIRLLANDPAIYAAVLKQHEEIKKNKPSGEFLTWEDLAKMKYTGRVAMETLRMIPPVFGGFRKTLKDIEYEAPLSKRMARYEFVRIETLVTVHYLVTQFTWKLCCNDNSIRRDPIPVPAQGLPIQIWPK
ncbi:unnamed protein product [Fraxinus pennsylvanica]|uniref:Cytochrome P450 n=1 Tax=Fraxinus pennsylvanica TaxID=56036 RepID=A0AAD1ZPC8_9LAMI|nr:unnamed protein product [Fraxinus pennsylvanica]